MEYFNDYEEDDVREVEEEIQNEIGELKKELADVDTRDVMAEYDDKVHELWNEVVLPFVEREPCNILQKLDYRHLNEFAKFVSKNSVGLGKLDIQIQIDNVKAKLAKLD